MIANLTEPYVLLIDDSFEGSELLRRSLEFEGYAAQVAANGLEAYEHLTKNRHHLPRVVLLDLYMPVMDGFEFLTRLSETAGLDDLPIYVISGTSQELPYAVAGYFEKPVDIDRVIATVDKYFRDAKREVGNEQNYDQGRPAAT